VWRARGDLNPGSPAPQASVLILTSHSETKMPPSDMETRPRAPTKYASEIINTLLWMKRKGLSEATRYTVAQKLRMIDKHADLMSPQSVLDFIADHKVCNATKTKYVDCYGYFAEFNKLEYEKPRYRYEWKVPLIPTTENIYKVISASSWKYSVIFTILEQTGLETKELETTKRSDIDADRGIINVQGCKGHNSRSLKLKPQTADLLRAYLQKYDSEHPFPKAKRMGERWRRIRNRLADKLNAPQLRQIPLRNLRHHYATTLYARTKDILLVKQRLGHKKIETTMIYTQLITFDEEDNYTSKIATNVQEVQDLVNHGFEYVTDIDGIKVFRKRKI